MIDKPSRRGRAAEITLSNDDKLHLAQMLQNYLLEELDQELGRFEAEFLLDHLAKYMGPLYYNMGVLDARSLLDKHVEELSDALYGLEQSVEKRK